MTEAYGANGRPISWVAVLVICIGTTIAGVALTLDPTWWMFWVGCGVTAAGVALACAVNIMADYSVEDH